MIVKYGIHSVYSDCGSWYPEACKVLNVNHYIHTLLEKGLIEKVMQYFKDRTESLIIIILAGKMMIAIVT
ncbi:MAG TPA: hypothetical protein VJ697_12690, partial [Nitrososphaeraceae archaeon]|nr:hypothetical protein [Nitrososphaeraceae archaeon]